MEPSLHDRTTIREYLLGRLDDRQELEESLSKEMLFNDELSEMVDSAEDEIIEEYLDGTLNSADMEAVEEYFLRPPERQEKLKFARLLRRHSETQPDVLSARKVADRGTAAGPMIHWRPRFRTYGELAALILLSIAGLTYLTSMREGLQFQIAESHKNQTQLKSELTQERENQTRLEGELKQERQRFAALEKQLQELQPAVAMLTLLPGLPRDDQAQPPLEIRATTQRIQADLVLEPASAGAALGPYDVRLETEAGRQIWTIAKLHPLTSANGARLVFRLPAQGIKTGAYRFVVGSPPGREEKYYFRARAMQ